MIPLNLLSFLPISRNRARGLYRYLSRKILRNPNIGHYEPSIIYSKEDANPTLSLIDLMVDSLKIAARTKLTSGKLDLPDSNFLNVFPGEHYRLLNAIVKASNSKKVVEIGTATGLSALAMQESITDISVITYDIMEWDKFQTHLEKADLDGIRIRQIIGDLSDNVFFNCNYDILNDADIIFMDAPKDDIFEYKMAHKLSTLTKKDFRLLIIDDIQFVNMIDFWRSITSPKIDMTSFGHWSGTGVVDISEGLKMRKE
jgi:predicted O-methyltransferase YrrM